MEFFLKSTFVVLGQFFLFPEFLEFLAFYDTSIWVYISVGNRQTEKTILSMDKADHENNF